MSNAFDFVYQHAFDSSDMQEKHDQFEENVAGKQAITIKAVLSQIFDATFLEEFSNVVFHGVEVPLESDILELAKNCMYADGFIYLTLIKN